MKVTNLQQQMLIKIATNEHTNINGAEPKSIFDVGSVWSSEIIETQQDKGAFTSMINAGLVEYYDGTVCLTETGFKMYLLANLKSKKLSPYKVKMSAA